MKLICLGLAVVSVILVLLAGCGGSSVSQSTSSEVKINAPLDNVYLAVDKESFDLWTKASVAKDYIGMADMESSGKVYTVKNGTKILVIDSKFGARQVRTLEGDNYGKTGWLPYEWVK